MMEKISILTKDGMIGVLALDHQDVVDVIGSYDQRSGQITRHTFPDPRDADHQYEYSINVSIERGWNLIYYGERNYG